MKEISVEVKIKTEKHGSKNKKFKQRKIKNLVRS